MHRLTHAFVSLLCCKDVQDHAATADAIEALLPGYCDEQKADLYALIHEAVTNGQPVRQRAEAISNALYSNERHFTRG